MKLLMLALLSFSLVSCATYNREPSSTNTDEDQVSRGVNADYYNLR